MKTKDAGFRRLVLTLVALIVVLDGTKTPPVQRTHSGVSSLEITLTTAFESKALTTRSKA
jgi:hypothetical protein